MALRPSLSVAQPIGAPCIVVLVDFQLVALGKSLLAYVADMRLFSEVHFSIVAIDVVCSPNHLGEVAAGPAAVAFSLLVRVELVVGCVDVIAEMTVVLERHSAKDASEQAFCVHEASVATVGCDVPHALVTVRTQEAE